MVYATVGTEQQPFDDFASTLEPELRGVADIAFAAHLEAHNLWSPSSEILDSVLSTSTNHFVQFYANYHSIFRHASGGRLDLGIEAGERAISLARDSLECPELHWLALVELAVNHDGLYQGIPIIQWLEHATLEVRDHSSEFLKYSFLTRRLALMDGEHFSQTVDLVSDSAFAWFTGEGMHLKAASVALNKCALLSGNK